MSYKNQIPTYNQAIQALKNGDDETVANALFAFQLEDGFSEALGYGLKIEDCSEDSLMNWEHADGSLFCEWIEKHD